jgi:tetratricopeptide (TPR) repeat protein/SAM-dependent methyltransferase
VTNQVSSLESLLNQGLALMNAGRLDEAGTLYARITVQFPDSADAWYMLSNINGRLGNIEGAGECCRRAIALRPDFTEAYLNLGNVFLHQGRLEQALEQYRKVLALDTGHVGAYINTGHVLSAMGRYEEADESYQTALDIDTTGAVFNALKQQGQALLQVNRLEAARELFKLICRVAPEDADAWHILSNVHGRLGDFDAAGQCSRRVLALRPDHGEAHVNLGHVYFQKGDLDEAAAQYLMALEIDPLSIPALNNLAKACRTQEQLERYFTYYRAAVKQLADPTPARLAFIEIIEHITPSEYISWMDEELQQCFSMEGINYRPLALPTALLLKHKYGIGPGTRDDHEKPRAMIPLIAADGLFLEYLEKTFNIDADLELLLTAIRRRLLGGHREGGEADGDGITVTFALAHQCSNNEYIFALDDEEAAKVLELRAGIEQKVQATPTPDTALERALSTYAMYERLYTLSCRTQLGEMPRSAWSERFRTLMEETLIHPLEEEAIKGEIRSLGAIQDQTSQLVQSQYEENPYPRWLSLPELRKGDIRRVLKQHLPHFTPPAFLDGPVRILVAGCGTGKHPIQTALSYDNVHVLAVDISKSSLAYAIRMARKYNVDNIEFMHADILELSKLDRRFHIIECSGVLHHMKDPVAGWRVLDGLLVDDGLMMIGLYSEIARKGVTAIGEVFRNEGLTPERDNIRAFRRRLMTGRMPDHGVPNSPGFYYTSGCRDLLFHYMEHRYTLPQLDEIIRRLNLKFLGFSFHDTKVRTLYQQRFPEDKTMTDLTSWDRFEHMYPTTFAGMYQFWCQKRPAV